ncbi:MAG TPA: hypothetical protein VF990_16890 [Candidatus Dormibacteraeota bacterium]
MWVREARTVPSGADTLVEALGRLSPDTLASLAEAASHDGCHLSASLATPVRRDEVTTFHLRWWHDRERSLTPALDGELALRPVGPDSTELAITARYRCRERLRELADTVFLRRLGEAVVATFLDSLVQIVSGTMTIAPAGHSRAQIPQPLQ